jgi:carbamoyl-phosphate synthase large subunit
MKNVLILSAGRRVSLVRGFQDAMLAYGNKVYAADISPELSAACQVADESFLLPRCNESHYSQAIEKLCVEKNIGLVIPTIDTELLLLSRLKEKLSELSIDIIVSDREIIEACRDKRKTSSFFKNTDLPTPTLYEKDSITYPVLIKPYDGSLSQGVHFVLKSEDMKDSFFENPKNIFCQYIDHNEHTEFTVDCYFDRFSDLKCVLPRERLEVRGGEVSKAMAVKNEIVETLFKNMAHVDGIVGCVNIQLFRHNTTHEHWYIEMNPRFGGGYPLTRCAGADFQSWLLREYFGGEKIDVFKDWKDGLTMLRYDGEVIVQS